LSALRRRGEWLEIRLVAETDEPTISVLSGRRIEAARDVDLLGREGDGIDIESDGSLRLPLDPWQIRTVRIGQAALSRS
ncbi:MAG TPA: hypothetical protein VI687_02475, partial [Candidatus Limnocylindrales bacterium]|nr:hypothetical protein [Candidatus Limnocylindrales bacterium]